MINALEVSLRFHAGACDVTVPILDEGLQYTVSRRLHLTLKGYARKHGIALPVALQLLRDEIHAT